VTCHARDEVTSMHRLRCCCRRARPSLAPARQLHLNCVLMPYKMVVGEDASFGAKVANTPSSLR
jgi:hypothetical protein